MKCTAACGTSHNHSGPAVSDGARVMKLFGGFLLALLVSACASVPFDYPKSESYAAPPRDTTRLGETVARWKEIHPGDSGFYPLRGGMDALGARLHLIEQADQAIDAQYFLIKGDGAGRLFAGKLLRAADRGVQVRFLVDDIFTTGLDLEFSLLNAHPNVQIRLFNPLSRRGLRFFNFLIGFPRVNRRMHNKSFTVDNVVTIVGGRNIADEYFGMHSDVEFADFELLGFGPVAPMVSATFDLFWNSERAVPMEAFGRKVKAAELEALRRRLAKDVEQARDGVYAKAVNRRFIDDIVQEKTEPFVSPVAVVTDRPAKLENPIGNQYKDLVSELLRVLEDAATEVIIVTPYFVPREQGVALLREIRARGVRVIVVTNSLASTNHVAVHSGYTPYRRELLEAGVELYELRATPIVAGRDVETDSSDRLALHAKAMIVDRKLLFVGSLNLDPRSIDINTEMGLFLEATEIATHFAERVEADLAAFTYRVVLDSSGRIEWRYEGEREAHTEAREPQAGFWRRLAAGFFKWLPIEGQL